MDGVPGQIGTVLVGILLLLSTSLLAPAGLLARIPDRGCLWPWCGRGQAPLRGRSWTLRSGSGSRSSRADRASATCWRRLDAGGLIGHYERPTRGCARWPPSCSLRSPEPDARRALATLSATRHRPYEQRRPVRSSKAQTWTEPRRTARRPASGRSAVATSAPGSPASMPFDVWGGHSTAPPAHCRHRPSPRGPAAAMTAIGVRPLLRCSRCAARGPQRPIGPCGRGRRDASHAHRDRPTRSSTSLAGPMG